MKTIGTLLITFLLTINLFASSLVVTSDLTADAVWDVDTVLIDKEGIEIKEGARLTIASGTHIIFNKSISFITVKGTITASGTVDDSIRITRLNPANSWTGIRLVPRSRESGKLDSSFFRFCVLRNTVFSSSEVLYKTQGTTLHCGAGNYISLKNCSITDSYGDIGGAVYCDSGSVVDIEDCYFAHNLNNRNGTISGGGAIMTSEKGSATLFVQNCRFERNSARTGGAVRIGRNSKVEFNNCVFYSDTTLSINASIGDIRGGALAIFGPTDVTLRNCIIFDCKSYDRGGGIYCSDASLKLINCTIVNNSSFYGGGIFFGHDSSASSPVLINTIEGGNGTLARLTRDSAGCGIFLDSAVTPSFRYCQMYDTVYDHTIKPYQGVFTGSRVYHTKFVATMHLSGIPDTVVEGFQLFSLFGVGDPSINGGDPDTSGLGLPEYDLLGKRRINGAVIDIGAMEFYDEIILNKPNARNRKQHLLSPAPGELTVYSLQGQKVGSFSGVFSSQSIQRFVHRKLPQGIYVVTFGRYGRVVWSKQVFVK